MKEEKLAYNKAFIDTVDTLSPVNHRVKIMKEDGNVVIRANNQASTFCYIITAPEDQFAMPVERLGIIDFTRFKKFYEAMSTKTIEPSLSLGIDDQNEACNIYFRNEGRSDKLTLSAGDCTLDTFKSAFNVLAEHASDAVLDFTEEQINELQRRISLVGADYIDISAKDNVLNFCIYSMRSADRADFPITLETPAVKDVNLKFAAEVLTLLPRGNYKMEIDADGCMNLKQVRDDGIELEIMLLAEG